MRFFFLRPAELLIVFDRFRRADSTALQSDEQIPSRLRPLFARCARTRTVFGYYGECENIAIILQRLTLHVSPATQGTFRGKYGVIAVTGVGLVTYPLLTYDPNDKS